MTKALRQSIWFIQGFVGKYKQVVLLSFFLTLIAIVFMWLVLPRLPRPKQVVYVGIVGKYAPSQIPVQIEKELGYGLVGLDERMLPIPGIAKSWEVSDDGKKYKLYLLGDLKWSNGDDLRLADLNLNIPDVQITRGEPDILEFSLPEPFAPFLSILTKPLIKDGVWSLGGYSVKDVRVSSQFLTQVTLDSTERQIVYRFYDSTGQALLAFKLGQIDVLDQLVEKPDVANWPNVVLEEKRADDVYVGLFFNNADPVLKDKSVRQALSYGLKDKGFGQERAVSPINPRSWAYNRNVKDYPYDVGRAKELLDQALPDRNKASLEITTTPELLRVAEKIKEDWQALGIQCEIRVVASKPATYQVLVYVQQIPADPDQYSMWHSTQETNFTRYESKRVDKLLEDGRQVLDLDRRREVYWDFQRFIAEDVPVLVLYHPTLYSLERK